ncbi:MFS transporter [Luteipulveratus sp. YIM 133132]|uniref:MFS transporter n=1 Tax=Luteipulveratus flavus TaxID=3031728 RepID=UPI0023AE9BEF|nr:MFS transporter [Luteipulveratus sp. YIM 133132]MDE9364146.1 MFS transporter [Luteipulveratus sp. YIM 133132]
MLTSLLRRAHRPADATRVYYVGNALVDLFWVLSITLNLVYQVTVVDLSPFELVVVGTVLEATCFLFEIPTGIVADLYSRRLSIIIGVLLIGAGFTLQGAVPALWAVLLAQVVWGIGYTFTSGAWQAWITDEVGEERVQHVFTREQQLSLAATFVGTALAGVLGLVTVQLPMVLGGVAVMLVGIWLALRMPEEHFHRTPPQERETFAHLARSFKDGLATARTRPVVGSFFLVSLFVGLSSEAFDRLWTARILDDFALPSLFGSREPALWFTVFALISAALSLVASLAANRWAGRALTNLHPNRLLAGLVLVQVVGVVGLALLGNLWLALGAMWARAAAQKVAYPVQSAWLNRHVDSRSRATVLSMNGQADAIGQVVGGPPLGALGSRAGIPVALVVSAGVLAPAAAVYARLRPQR